MTPKIYSPSVEDQIAYLQVALELQVLDVPEIVQWADDQISADECPAFELIELVLMGGSNQYDIASQLLRVGTPSLRRAEVLPYVLAKAHGKLLLDRDFGKVLARAVPILGAFKLRLSRPSPAVWLFRRHLLIG